MKENGATVEELDLEEPPEPREPEVWTRVEIWTADDMDTVRVYVETNDNDDDGYPDQVIVSWTRHFPSLEAAMKQYGKSHYGMAGHRVDVFVDGKKV
jgi:hypothetical protein